VSHVTDTEITLLDGAAGTEVRARGVHVRDYESSLWSALARPDRPADRRLRHEELMRRGDPPVDLRLEEHQGQASGTEDLTVELPDVEAITERLFRTGAQLADP